MSTPPAALQFAKKDGLCLAVPPRSYRTTSCRTILLLDSIVHDCANDHAGGEDADEHVCYCGLVWAEVRL